MCLMKTIHIPYTHPIVQATDGAGNLNLGPKNSGSDFNMSENNFSLSAGLNSPWQAKNVFHSSKQDISDTHLEGFRSADLDTTVASHFSPISISEWKSPPNSFVPEVCIDFITIPIESSICFH